MIKLVEMDTVQYQAQLQITIDGYARELVNTGLWSEAAAFKKADSETKNQISKAIESSSNYWFHIVLENSDTVVGYLWFTIEEQYNHSFAFVCDFEISPEFRRKGYGRAALKALEEFVCDVGVTSVRLHVFAFNQEAQALYAELGFSPIGIQMEKSIERAAKQV